MAAPGILIKDNDNDILLQGLRLSYSGAQITDAVLSVTYGEWLDKGTITGATNASPIVITSAAHGRSNGDIVVIRDVHGNLAANTTATVANVTANTFELSGVAGNGNYISGGEWFHVRTGMSNLALTRQTGTADYLATLLGSVSLVDGEKFLEVITATNYNLRWEREVTVRKR
jgi:hypothetical protein